MYLKTLSAPPAPDQKCKPNLLQTEGKRSDGGEKPKGFGTEVTADHFIAKDEIDQSIAGEKVGLVIHCRGSDWLDLYPCPTNDAGSAETAFIHFQGAKDEIKSFYSDDSRELKKAAVNRGWLQDDSTPGRPDTNGDAEVSVRRILEGTRCALEHAGMAPGWWSYAGKHFASAHNFTRKFQRNNDLTPYEARNSKQPFVGVLAPFGCLIDFKPSPVRGKIVSKFAARAVPGLFLGWHMSSGGRFELSCDHS